MEFLRELMDLQKEMVTLLLSMLEGNVLNGPIGKQMVDTLALCSDNVEQVLQFFTTFLKYSEIVAGVSFKVSVHNFEHQFSSNTKFIDVRKFAINNFQILLKNYRSICNIPHNSSTFRGWRFVSYN